MHKIKQGTKSTTVQSNEPLKQLTSHDLHIQTIRTDNMEDTVSPERLKELLATDLPGRYPITSARGNKYLFVMYDYDANYIHAMPIKSRKSEELIRGFSESYAVLTKHDFRAKSIRFDNEISVDFKEQLTSIQLPYQLIPRVTTERTQQREPSNLSRIISLLCSVEKTLISLPIVGTY